VPPAVMVTAMAAAVWISDDKVISDPKSTESGIAPHRDFVGRASYGPEPKEVQEV
jgi:hypothetical protein